MEEKNKIIKWKPESNYGALTDISKDLNAFLGDKSGRTVSRRTAHGLKNGLNLDMDDDAAETIVHGGMIATTTLLKSKDETSNGIGFLLLAALVACYVKGE
jgi:hypothetical protein